MALTSDNEIKIFVKLTDEIVDVWRPTAAISLGGDVYKILPTPNYDPEVEEWEFAPGSIVRAEIQTHSCGEILVAVELIN